MKSLIKINCFSLLILIAACSSDSKDNTSSKPLTDKKNVSDSWSGEDKQRAVDSCVQSGNIEKFCECSVSVLTSLFSYQEFQSFDAQIKSGIQPAPNIVSKMIEMSKRVGEQCKKE